VATKRFWSEVTGSGEPLLLIHGMGSASTAWKLITPKLAKNFQLITVDLPGHGNTPLLESQSMDPISLATALVDLMDAYGISQFHVCGNSLGGWIALEIAAKYPDRVKSVIGLAPAGLWLTPFTNRLQLSAQSKYLASILRTAAPTLLQFEFARKIGFKLVSPKWQALSYETCLDAALAMGSARGYFPAWEGTLKKRFDKEISEKIPLTIIFGDSDNTLPIRTSQERSLVPKHAKWIVLSNCGHAPMWDRVPEVCAEIIETASSAK
jgi:pimeloyl-ACP methyl ester carboxylesterase